MKIIREWWNFRKVCFCWLMGWGTWEWGLCLPVCGGTYPSALLKNPEISMEECIQDSQDRLLEEQKRLKAENSMKTTITALEVCEKSARFFTCGRFQDLLFRKNKYYSRSLDHSVSPDAVHKRQNPGKGHPQT